MIFERFQEVVSSTAQAFRLGMAAQGSEGLVALIDCLPSMLQPSVESDKLNRVLGEIMMAQERKDHLYIADLLDYELLALLGSGN